MSHDEEQHFQNFRISIISSVLLALPKMLLEEYFKLSHIKKKLQKLMINMG